MKKVTIESIPYSEEVISRIRPADRAYQLKAANHTRFSFSGINYSTYKDSISKMSFVDGIPHGIMHTIRGNFQIRSDWNGVTTFDYAAKDDGEI